MTARPRPPRGSRPVATAEQLTAPLIVACPDCGAPAMCRCHRLPADAEGWHGTHGMRIRIWRGSE